MRSKPVLFFFLPFTLALAGCTSLPFAPESGPGAAITLVTLDHVEERERALRDTFDETVATQVEAAVRAAREEDRARLDEFATRLEEHETELLALTGRVDTNAETSLELARVVDERLNAVAAEAESLAAQARRLESEIGGLPVATLDRLRRVLAAHLETSAASAGPVSPPAIPTSGDGT